MLDGADAAALSAARLRRYRRRTLMIFHDPYSSLDARVPIADSIAEPPPPHPYTVALLSALAACHHS